MGDITMTFSQIITVITILVAVIGAYWKLQIDQKRSDAATKLSIAQLDTYTRLKITELETMFALHKRQNDVDMEKMHCENRAEHKEILLELKKITSKDEYK